MKRMDLWKLSLLNVFASPVRSLLTVLGMAIGVGAILAVVTLGEAGRVQVRAEMGRLGIDKVWLTAGESKLSQGDAALLAKRLNAPAGEAVYLTATVRVKERGSEAAVVGCTPDYLSLTGAELADGRMLYPLEWESDSRSILMGEALAAELGLAAGEEASIQGFPFWVRGTVKASSGLSRVEADRAVFLPIGVAARWLGGEVHEILLDVPEGFTPQEAAEAAQHVLKTTLDKTAQATTMQVQMDAADSVMVIFVEVLRWVALICILVGGIGVMNILLVSVRERRREIGVMKSMGATHAQICALFLTEALCYAFIGGLLGVWIGLALVAAAGRSIGLETAASGSDCLLVFLAALGVGLFFGVVPASRAAKLSCVEALRSE